MADEMLLGLPQEEQPQPSIPIRELRIGFGRRLGAWLIDAVFIGVLTVIVGLAVGPSIAPLFESRISAQLSEQNVTLDELNDNSSVYEMVRTVTVASFLATVIALLYSLTEIAFAASPGKMLLKIMIASADGIKASTGTLALRWLVKAGVGGILSIIGTVGNISIATTLASLLGIVIFIGCFFVLSANRQALHDLIAKTAVFRREHVQALSEPQL